MNEDLKALAGTVARIHSIYADVEEFVNLAKGEGAEVANLPTSSNRIVVTWPNGYEVTITITLPVEDMYFNNDWHSDVGVNVVAVLRQNGIPTSLRPYPSLKAALAERHR